MQNPATRNFFHELRRREVFKTVALYIVGAWVMLQVADLAFPGMDIPDAAIRYVWLAAILLFPLVLIFAWRYDLSTAGIRRTLPADAVDENRALHGSDYGTIGGLSVIALGVLTVMAVQISRVEHEREFAAPANSIAVMPFEICEAAPLDLLLARSLASEVINRLAERGKLKVIARASVDAFAGFGLAIPEIAKPLGVEYVLKGEVCRDGANPTLTAELSDERGFIVWSGSFTQQVNEFEQITARLASQVADGVAAELGDVLVLQADPPVNRRAYEYLLIGREHYWRREREEGRAALEKALEIDPDYAAARLMLARVERKFSFGLEGGKGLEQARTRAREALALAERQLAQYPQSAQAHFVLYDTLSILAHWDRDQLWREKLELSEEEFDKRKDAIDAMFAESERHLRTAMSLNPSRGEFYLELAWVIEEQGRERIAEALAILERGLEIDPLNPQINGLVARRWSARGRYRQAVELLERLKPLPDPPIAAWAWQLNLMMLQDHWDEGIETLIDLMVKTHELHGEKYYAERVAPRLTWWSWEAASGLASLGFYEEAEAWKARVEKFEIRDDFRRWGRLEYLDATGRGDQLTQEYLAEVSQMSNEQVLNAFQDWAGIYAYTLAEVGQYDRAIELMKSVSDAPADRSEKDGQYLLHFARIYQAAGRHDDAEPLLRELVDLLEAEYELGIRHPQKLATLASAYLLQGRNDEALGMLRKAIDYGNHHRFFPYRDRPAWNDVYLPWNLLYDDPRFITQMKRIQADLDRQAERVRAILAQHDLDELLAQLMPLAPEIEEPAQIQADQ